MRGLAFAFAALVVLAAVLLSGPVSRIVSILGIFRNTSPAAVAADKIGTVFRKIDDTMHCEDLHYYQPANKLFTACEDSTLPRFEWFPPLGISRNRLRPAVLFM
ncbi:hypothetical protein MAP00_008183 [Monascus purpureus]|nr:hypothetical protein MAP00_008183 [Monascus purpureus]